MSRPILKTLMLFQSLLLAGAVAWGLVLWFEVKQARRAGGQMADALKQWTEGGCAPLGTRENLIVAAEDLRDGEFSTAAELLGPPRDLSAKEEAAAQQFFAAKPELRRRLVTAVNAAGVQEADGSDVHRVRDALARAVAAAAREDEATVSVQLDLAETALDPTGAPGGAAVASGPVAVAESIRQIGPAFRLGQDLMTEGHAAAEKLVARASWHYQAREYAEAAAMVRLAAEFLGVELATPASAVTPKWFDDAAVAPTETIDAEQANAAVELCEAMASSAEPAPPVTTLIKKARQELAAGRFAEAHWWAGVALNTLGMTDDAIAAAEPPETEAAE